MFYEIQEWKEDFGLEDLSDTAAFFLLMYCYFVGLIAHILYGEKRPEKSAPDTKR